MTDFKARRPIIKNLIRLVLSLGVAIALIPPFISLYQADPLDFKQKLFQCVLFCIFVVWEVFNLAFFTDGLRSLLAAPTVAINNEELKVFGYPSVKLSAIEKTEIINLAKNPKKNFPAIAVSIKGENDPIIIKKGLTGIPLDTVKYAIDIRL
jgi:hypothetical protein